MGYLGATLTQVFTHAREQNGCFTQRYHNSPHWKRVTECRWRHAPEERGWFWEILKKSVSRVETRHRTRRLAFVCSWRPLCRVPHVLTGGGRWKSQNRKIVPLSLYVEEPLNSKIIKGFVPELRSRYVFFVFRDSYVLCYIFMDIWCTF